MKKIIKEHPERSALLFTCVLGQQNSVPGPEAVVSQTSQGWKFSGDDLLCLLMQFKSSLHKLIFQ